MAAATIHVQELIDRQAVGRLHIVVVGLCALVMCVDGFDMFMIGAIAPAIASSFGKPVSALVIVFLCQQIGIACGAIIVGPISDRYGRKTLLIGCSAAFGVLMLATTASRTLWELAVLRGVSGFFLSGIYPVATTLVSEFAPKRWRAAFLSILLTGFVASATAGGAFAAILVAAQGWQIAFWLGGFVPLLMLLPLAFFLPESVQFRARRNANDPSIAATLNRLSSAANIPADATFLAATPGQGAASWLDVISGSRRLPTFLLWLIFFLAMGNGALVSSWLPSVFKATQGVPIERFAQFMLLGSVTAILGTLCIGFLVDRYRGSLVMMTCYVLNAAMLLGLGLFPFGTALFTVALSLVYLSGFAGTAGLMAIASAFYPSEVRATGFGWCVAAGRLGSIAGPLLGGYLLVTNLSTTQIFTVIAAAPLVVATFLFLFSLVSLKTQLAVSR